MPRVNWGLLDDGLPRRGNLKASLIRQTPLTEPAMMTRRVELAASSMDPYEIVRSNPSMIRHTPIAPDPTFQVMDPQRDRSSVRTAADNKHEERFADVESLKRIIKEIKDFNATAVGGVFPPGTPLPPAYSISSHPWLPSMVAWFGHADFEEELSKLSRFGSQSSDWKSTSVTLLRSFAETYRLTNTYPPSSPGSASVPTPPAVLAAPPPPPAPVIDSNAIGAAIALAVTNAIAAAQVPVPITQPAIVPGLPAAQPPAPNATAVATPASAPSGTPLTQLPSGTPPTAPPGGAPPAAPPTSVTNAAQSTTKTRPVLTSSSSSKQPPKPISGRAKSQSAKVPATVQLSQTPTLQLTQPQAALRNRKMTGQTAASASGQSAVSPTLDENQEKISSELEAILNNLDYAVRYLESRKMDRSTVKMYKLQTTRLDRLRDAVTKDPEIDQVHNFSGRLGDIPDRINAGIQAGLKAFPGLTTPPRTARSTPVVTPSPSKLAFSVLGNALSSGANALSSGATFVANLLSIPLTPSLPVQQIDPLGDVMTSSSLLRNSSSSSSSSSVPLPISSRSVSDSDVSIDIDNLTDEPPIPQRENLLIGSTVASTQSALAPVISVPKPTFNSPFADPFLRPEMRAINLEIGSSLSNEPHQWADRFMSGTTVSSGLLGVLPARPSTYRSSFLDEETAEKIQKVTKYKNMWAPSVTAVDVTPGVALKNQKDRPYIPYKVEKKADDPPTAKVIEDRKERYESAEKAFEDMLRQRNETRDYLANNFKQEEEEKYMANLEKMQDQKELYQSVYEKVYRSKKLEPANQAFFSSGSTDKHSDPPDGEYFLRKDLRTFVSNEQGALSSNGKFLKGVRSDLNARLEDAADALKGWTDEDSKEAAWLFSVDNWRPQLLTGVEGEKLPRALSDKSVTRIVKEMITNYDDLRTSQKNIIAHQGKGEEKNLAKSKNRLDTNLERTASILWTVPTQWTGPLAREQLDMASEFFLVNTYSPKLIDIFEKFIRSVAGMLTEERKLPNPSVKLTSRRAIADALYTIESTFVRKYGRLAVKPEVETLIYNLQKDADSDILTKKAKPVTFPSQYESSSVVAPTLVKKHQEGKQVKKRRPNDPAEGRDESSGSINLGRFLT